MSKKRLRTYLAGCLALLVPSLGAGCSSSNDAAGGAGTDGGSLADASDGNAAHSDAVTDAGANHDADAASDGSISDDATGDATRATDGPDGSDAAVETEGASDATNADGGEAGETGDANADAAPVPFPAPHPSAPQIVNSLGPVLSAPQFVPIFFSNEDANVRAKLLDFESKLGGSTYFAAVSEYGVGAASTAAPVQLNEMASGTISDAEIQAWLASKLDSDDPAFPSGGNQVYVLHYPGGVTVTLENGGGTNSCQAFGAYHNSVTLDQAHGNANVAYVVVPRCNNYDGFTGIDALTAAASAPLLEAVTDPFPNANPAWSAFDDAHFAFTLAGAGGEIGSFCALDLSSFTKFADLPYEVQRVWSNSAAAAGHDPCAPALANEVYFNAAPVLPDTATLASTQTSAVKIPSGQSRTIELDLFSDAPTSGPWNVVVVDYASSLGGSAALSFDLQPTSGSNGTKLALTIHALKTFPTGAIFLVTSSSGQAAHLWAGLVVN